MHTLLSPATENNAAAYLAVQLLADQLDCDELAENMMDQIICLDWEYSDVKQCLHLAKCFSIYIELFGRGIFQDIGRRAI